MAKSPTAPLGGGERFASIVRAAAARGARNPGGVAYAAGVKAHGKTQMAAWAAAGRKRKRRRKATAGYALMASAR